MTIAYVNRASAAGKTVQLTGVTAGNLIVAMIQWQDGTGTPTISDGSSTWAYANVVNNSNAEFIRIAYTLSSVASGTVTYTWTAAFGAGHTAHVFETSSTVGFALDTSNAGATGSGTIATSANATSTENPMVAFGGGGIWASAAYLSATLDGTAVDYQTNAQDNSYGSSGALTMRVMNNPGTYASAITFGTSQSWAADVIGFKESAGGGTAHEYNTGNTFLGAVISATGTFSKGKNFVGGVNVNISTAATISKAKNYVGATTVSESAEAVASHFVQFGYSGVGILSLSTAGLITRLTQFQYGGAVTTSLSTQASMNRFTDYSYAGAATLSAATEATVNHWVDFAYNGAVVLALNSEGAYSQQIGGATVYAYVGNATLFMDGGAEVAKGKCYVGESTLRIESGGTTSFIGFGISSYTYVGNGVFIVSPAATYYKSSSGVYKWGQKKWNTFKWGNGATTNMASATPPTTTGTDETVPGRGAAQDGAYVDTTTDGAWTEPPLDGAYTADNAYYKEMKPSTAGHTTEAKPRQ